MDQPEQTPEEKAQKKKEQRRLQSERYHAKYNTVAYQKKLIKKLKATHEADSGYLRQRLRQTESEFRKHKEQTQFYQEKFAHIEQLKAENDILLFAVEQAWNRLKLSDYICKNHGYSKYYALLIKLAKLYNPSSD